MAKISIPTNLFDQYRGIEEDLRRRHRLGTAGALGLLVVLLPYALTLIDGTRLDKILPEGVKDWLRRSDLYWPLVISLPLLILSAFLFIWARFLMREATEPFGYTYSVAAFEPAAAGTPLEPTMSWLRTDLLEKLSDRIGRLTLLDQAAPEAVPTITDAKSHIDVSGYYLVRPIEENDTTTTWVIEVTPWVRIGPAGAPASLAQTIRFPLDAQTLDGRARRATELPSTEESAKADPPVDSSRIAEPDQGRATQDREATTQARGAPDIEAEPLLLTRKGYDQLSEGVYFSVATQIYDQIRRDVERKIRLLPRPYFRAAAYFHEAEDFARSNTLAAYDQAGELYDEALRLYDPRYRPDSSYPIRRWLQHRTRSLVQVPRRLRRWGARFWRGLGRPEVIVAGAEIGYVNMLIARRTLAMLSGGQANPIFLTSQIADRAVDRLVRLYEEVPGRRERLFDAYVTRALSQAHHGCIDAARADLANARSEMPDHPDQDACYVLVSGLVQARNSSAVAHFKRSSELDPRFELARIHSSIASERTWRALENPERRTVGPVLKEYTSLVRENPGIIAAWANLGYIHWIFVMETYQAFDAANDEVKQAVERSEKAAQVAFSATSEDLEVGAAAFEEAEVAAEEAESADEVAKARWKDVEQALDRAQEQYSRGYQYKQIKRDTVVAEIEFGLGRVAAERDKFVEALEHFSNAASVAASWATHSHGYFTPYYFETINRQLMRRFEVYMRTVEGYYRKVISQDDASQPGNRLGDLVYAFVRNDFGEACLAYFRRFGSERHEQLAYDAFREAMALNEQHDGNHIAPYVNLYQSDPSAPSWIIDRVIELEPDWPSGRLTKASDLANQAWLAKRRVDGARRDLAAHLDRTYSIRPVAPDVTSSLAQVLLHQASRLSSQLLRRPTANGGSVSADATFTGVSDSRAGRDQKLGSDPASTRELGRLEDELKHHTQVAESLSQDVTKHFQSLIPHQWLWTTRAAGRAPQFNWELFRPKARTAAVEWEREFNDLQAAALVNWASLHVDLLDTDGREHILTSGEATAKDIDGLLAHVEAHLFPEDISVLRLRRRLSIEVKEERRGYEERIERILTRALSEDRSSYQRHRDMADFGDLVLRALETSQESVDRDRATKAYRVARGFPHPRLWFELAGQLERIVDYAVDDQDALTRLEEAYKTYQQISRWDDPKRGSEPSVEHERSNGSDRRLAEASLRSGDIQLRIGRLHAMGGRTDKVANSLNEAWIAYEEGRSRRVTRDNARFQAVFHARQGFLAAWRGDEVECGRQYRKSVEARHDHNWPDDATWSLVPNMPVESETYAMLQRVWRTVREP